MAGADGQAGEEDRFVDGDPGTGGIPGAKVPHLSDPRWRWFYTQQHGDNTTYQVVPASHGG